MQNKSEIPKPSAAQVEKYLKKWDEKESYVASDRALNQLFQTFPDNTKIEDILLKVTALNKLYSTNIYATFEVAKHILSLNIDKKLISGDASLVAEIANTDIIRQSGKKMVIYSFATKYCSFHNPDAFPMYDFYVENVLMYFKKKDKFYKFRGKDLKDYSTFKDVLEEFKIHYKITSYSTKEIDMYLWQLGKKYISESKK